MLEHTTLRNITVATRHGEITFDENGISNDLNAEKQKTFGNLRGFKYTANTPTKEDKEKQAELEQADKEAKEAAAAADKAIEDAKSDAQAKQVAEAKAKKDASVAEHKKEEDEKAAPKKKATRKPVKKTDK